MALTVKYFSFTDPINGQLTKDYGWDVDLVSTNLEVRVVNGKSEVKKNEPVSRTVNVRPKGSNLTELSQKDFEALDTSSESAFSKRRREDNQIALELKSVKGARKAIDAQAVKAIGVQLEALAAAQVK